MYELWPIRRVPSCGPGACAGPISARPRRRRDRTPRAPAPRAARSSLVRLAAARGPVTEHRSVEVGVGQRSREAGKQAASRACLCHRRALDYLGLGDHRRRTPSGCRNSLGGGVPTRAQASHRAAHPQDRVGHRRELGEQRVERLCLVPRSTCTIASRPTRGARRSASRSRPRSRVRNGIEHRGAHVRRGDLARQWLPGSRTARGRKQAGTAARAVQLGHARRRASGSTAPSGAGRGLL